jgi:hypothetical protein
MSTLRVDRRAGLMGGRVSVVTAVIAALAMTVPVAEAGAAAPRAGATAATATVRAASPPVVSSAHRSPRKAGAAVGPTLIEDVFNGGTVILTSTSPVTGMVVGPS